VATFQNNRASRDFSTIAELIVHNGNILW